MKKTLKEIQNSINNFHTENSYIRDKLEILESNNYAIGRNKHFVEENHLNQSKQFNAVPNPDNFQGNSGYNPYAKNYQEMFPMNQ